MHWWHLSLAEELALHTGVSATTVHRVIARDNRLGPHALEQSEKGGRRHGYLTVEQEQAFLQPFFARADRGEIATVEHIHQAFEEQVKQEVHINSISRLWHRHGWRKLAPRSRHPKANRAVNRMRFTKKLQERSSSSSSHARAD